MAEMKPAMGEDTGLVEKAFLMGLGAAAIAKEKAEELADELVRRGKLNREQSGTFVNRLASQAEDAGRSAQETMNREVERAVSKMGLASQKDIDEIRGELTEIKALIASMRPVDTGSSQV